MTDVRVVVTSSLAIHTSARAIAHERLLLRDTAQRVPLDRERTVALLEARERVVPLFGFDPVGQILDNGALDVWWEKDTHEIFDRWVQAFSGWWLFLARVRAIGTLMDHEERLHLCEEHVLDEAETLIPLVSGIIPGFWTGVAG